MAFQVESIKAVSKCIKKGSLNRSVLAIYEDEDQYRLNYLMYGNPLEEVSVYLEDNLNILRETANSFFISHGKNLQDNTVIALTVPIIMTPYNGPDIVCPTFMYLLNSGLGVIKVRVPLERVDSENFATSPTKRWYKSVKMPHYLNEGAGFIESEENDTKKTNDITDLLYSIAFTSFGKYLKSKERIVCFENITLLEPLQMEPNSVLSCQKVDRLAFKESEQTNEKNSNQSMKEVSFGGRIIISDRPGLIITSGSLKKLKEGIQNEEGITDLEFLENSIQHTFDWSICLALWKKVNEITCLMASGQKPSEISKSIAKYNMLQHDLDSMLDLSSFRIKQAYCLILQNIEYEMGGYSERIGRMEKIEEYGNKQLSNMKSVFMNLMMLLVTVLFGLPTIRDTVLIAAGPPSENSIPYIDQLITTKLSLSIWGLIVAFIFVILVINIVSYYSRKIR